MERVFSDPTLREGLEGPTSGLGALLAQVRAKISEWFQRLVVRLGDLRVASPVLFWLLFGGLVLLLVLLLAHIGWTAYAALRATAPLRDDEHPATRARQFRDLRREARDLASAGRFRDATRLLLLALLALIEERKVLRVARGWTHREIARRLSLRGAGAEDLGRFTGAVERVWYGGATPDAESYREVEGLLDRVSSSLPRDAEAAR